MRLLQLSDPHLFSSKKGRLSGRSTWNSFASVVKKAALHLRHEGRLIVTGDIAQDERPGAYRLFSMGLEKIRKPVMVVPGNHDAPLHMKHVLLKKGFDILKPWFMDPWLIVPVSTHLPGKAEGRISMSYYRRLETFLKRYSHMHALIVMHHHPIPVGSAVMDSMMLRNNQKFQSLIKRNINVKGVIFGHVHQAFDRVVRSVRYLGAPATSVQFKPGMKKTILDRARPGFRVLSLENNGAIKTSVVRV